MSMNESFVCPACGAEYDVQERLEERPASQAATAPSAAMASEVNSGPVSFQCPACGADYEIQEKLTEEQVRR